MADTIGTLEYKVQASATSAIDALDKLEQKLLSVSRVLDKMPTNNGIFKDIAAMARAFDSVGNAAKKAQKDTKTKVEVDISQLKSAQEVLDAVSGKVNDFGKHIPMDMGRGLGEWLADANVKAAELEDKIESMLKSGASSSELEPVAMEFAQISKAIDYATEKVREYRRQTESIAPGTPGLDDISGKTYDYGNVEEQIQAAEASVFRVSDAMRSLGSSWTPPKSWGMDKLADEASRLELKIESLRDKRRQLERSGGSEMKLRLNEADIAQAENKIDAIDRRIEELGRAAEEAGNSANRASKKFKLFGNAEGSFKGFSKLLKNIGGHVANFGKKLSSVFGKSGGGLLGRRSLGQFVGLIAFRRLITSAIRALVSGIKEGSDNLTQYSASYNAAISSIVTSLNFLKNAWAAAFAPIVEAVAPYLQAFVDMIANALNAVGRFMAALTGKGFAVQAVKVFSDYAKGLKGTGSAAGGAKKALDEYKKTILSFDELHVLNDVNDKASSGGGGGGGGGGTSTAISDMFTTVEVSQDSFGGKLRAMIEDSNWEGVGKAIADKVGEQLANIPWDSIKQKAGNFGKGLAEFLNGAASSESLWSGLGNAIAQGLNTALTFAEKFLTIGNFRSYGNAIGRFIGTAIREFDWGIAGKDIALAFNALFNFIRGVMEQINWQQLGNNIKNALKAFFKNISWSDFGGVLRTAFDSLLDFIIGVLPSTKEWGQIGKNMINAIIDGIVGFADGNAEALALKIGAALLRIIDAALHVTAPHLTAINGLMEKYLGFGFEDALNEFGIKSLGQTADDLSTRADEMLGKGNKSGGLVTRTAQLIVNMNKNSKTNAKLYNETKVGGRSTVTATAKTTSGFTDTETRYKGFKDKNATVSALGHASASYTGLESSFKGGVWSSHAVATKILAADKKAGGNYDAYQKNYYAWQSKTNLVSMSATALKAYTDNQKNYNGWGSKTVTVTTEGKPGTTFGQAKKDYQSLSNKTVYATVEGGFKITSVSVTSSAQAQFSSKFQPGKAYMAGGGLFANGRWNKITQYASGGNPFSGEVFVAREAGPELVGTIGGHTAVLNNDQIVSSVSAGVYNAVLRANAVGGQNKRPVFDITVKTENNEVLARAVHDGEASLGYRRGN